MIIIIINNIEYEILKYKIIDRNNSKKYIAFNKIKCEIEKKNNIYSDFVNLSMEDIDAVLIDDKMININNCEIGDVYSNETVTFNIYYDYLSDDVDINIVRRYKLKKLWY